MKKLVISGTALTVAILLLSACSSNSDNSAPLKSGMEKFQIITTVSAPEASLAFVETSPVNYLKPKYKKYVVGAVRGQITRVDYSAFLLPTGVDENANVDLAVNVMTVRVESSTFEAPTEIKVATTGAYLSPEVSGVYGQPSEQFGTNGVVEYETLGGAKPPVAGENVILFLGKSSGPFVKLAPYSVIGASYGRYTLDEATGKFTRKMAKAIDAASFNTKEITGDLLK